MLCVSARMVALLGQRPEQREQLQWPFRVYMCGEGVIKTADCGGYGARAASGAREQAHRHHCLNVCPATSETVRVCNMEAPLPTGNWRKQPPERG